MSISTEFPTFPLSSLPSLPSTWEDVSWHNDACPSWHVGNEVYVYIDFPNVEDREFPTSERYTVINMTSDEVLIHTSDWEAVLNAVK